MPAADEPVRRYVEPTPAQVASLINDFCDHLVESEQDDAEKMGVALKAILEGKLYRLSESALDAFHAYCCETEFKLSDGDYADAEPMVDDLFRQLVALVQEGKYEDAEEENDGHVHGDARADKN